MEILTCPKCLNQIKTAKALQFGEDKQVKCGKCGFYHSLGVARAGYQAPSQQPQQVVYVERRPKRDNTAGMIAGIASFFVPGLGQLILGKPIAALGWLVFTLIGYAALIAPGIVLHIWCVICAVRDGKVA